MPIAVGIECFWRRDVNGLRWFLQSVRRMARKAAHSRIKAWAQFSKATIMDDLTKARDRMIVRQLIARGICDYRVLGAMRRVPREAFVDTGLQAFAYDDTPLPIDAYQTVSQPFMVALMLQVAELKPGDHVLEVGTGSGYAAAVLAELVERVDTVERHAVLADSARERLAALGYRNVVVHALDGTQGLPQAAPFDAIIAAASGSLLPVAWREQLKPGGRVVMPLGSHDEDQRLIRFTLREHGFDATDFGAVRFVRLISGSVDRDLG
jgi:protein-L-isoaspartate(D-aspartate) O-methyltransferase